MGAAGSVATDIESFEAERKSSLREEEKLRLRNLLERNADVRTQEALQERLQKAKRGSVQYELIENEYINWIARQVAMKISEQALQDAISSLRGAGCLDTKGTGGRGASFDEGKRK